MKQLLKFAVAAIAAVAAQGAAAQLVINNNGTANFGDTAVVDTAATVHVAGIGANGSRGTVAFGNRYDGLPSVLVGERVERSQYVIANDVYAGRNVDTNRTAGDLTIAEGSEYEIETKGQVVLAPWLQG